MTLTMKSRPLDTRYQPVADPPGRSGRVWMWYPGWSSEVEGLYAPGTDGQRRFFWSTGGFLMGEVTPSYWRPLDPAELVDIQRYFGGDRG
jgi:hypothetical protein